MKQSVVRATVLVVVVFLWSRPARAVWPMPPYTSYPCATSTDNCQTQAGPASRHTQTRLSFRSVTASCTPYSDPYGGYCFGGGCTDGWCRQPAILGASASVIASGPDVLIQFDLEYDFPNSYCQLDTRSDYTSSWWPIIYNDDHMTRLQLLTTSNSLIFESMAVFEHGRWTPTIAGSCTPGQTYRLRLVNHCGYSATQDVTVTLSPSVCGAKDKFSCPASAPGLPSSVGGPVNVGSGDVSYSEPLFQLSEPDTPLSFSLAYHSEAYEYPSLLGLPLGSGWTHSFNQVLKPTDGTLNELYHVAGDGTERRYSRVSAGVWNASSPAELRGQVTQVGSEYRLRDLDGTTTAFDAATGRWLSTSNRWGQAITGAYTSGNLTSLTTAGGRQVLLTYASGRISQITAGANVWQLNYTGGVLTSIQDPMHPATAWRTYTYTADSHSVVRLLTGVLDESGALLEGHAYDARDRGTSSYMQGNRDLVTLEYDTPAAGQTRVTHAIDGTVNRVSTYTLTYQSGRYLPTAIDGGCVSCGSAESETAVYNASNLMTRRITGIDRSGSGGSDERSITDYTYDANAQIATMTEAVGKPEEHTVTYAHGMATWPAFVTSTTEASVAKPGENRVTTRTWNAGESELTTTVSGYLSSTDTAPTEYTTVATYDSRHRLVQTTGPGTDQKVVRDYYADTDSILLRRGRLQQSHLFTSATDSLPTTFDDYDVYGTARTETDANGVDTLRGTDARGRVTTITSVHPQNDSSEPGNYVTTYAYDGRDRLTSITSPRGNLTRFGYEDGTNRLTATIRATAAGLEEERMLLTLNPNGSKSAEAAQECATPANPCTTWTTRRSDTFTYDSLGRLSTVVHPVGGSAAYAYDSRGNLGSLRDERHTSANTLYKYDARNRLTEVRQKRTLVAGTDIVTAYEYDDDGNLTSVTDPNGNTTTYLYDDFGRMQTQTSPVTGTSTYVYDAAGNLITSTDANGATVERAYDAANRVLTASSSANLDMELITWTYDDPAAGAYGKGRLTAMDDSTGTTTYAYDRRGLLRQEEHTFPLVESGTWTAAYAYDANGNRTTVTSPLGRSITYTFDHADRPYSAQATGRVYVTAAEYQPFGPLKRLEYGNQTVKSVTHDARYRVLGSTLTSPGGTLADYSYVWDGSGNVTEIDDAGDAGYDRTFAYDDLNRLVTANTGSALWGNGSYAYDAMGNMTELELGTSRVLSFAYDGTTPRIESVSGTAPAWPMYDEAGNELTGGRQYGPRNLMTRIVGGSMLHPAYHTFDYDGRGVRLRETTTSTWPQWRSFSTYRFYSPELHLLAFTNWMEAEAPPVLDKEIVWFGAEPVAQDSLTGSPVYTFTDHLGAPVLQTDASAAVVWRAEYEPYGQVFTYRVGDAWSSQILRLPGQELSGGDDNGDEHYNIFRWYRGGWGRYTQADPLGLVGKEFPYASDNPASNTDVLGLRDTGSLLRGPVTRAVCEVAGEGAGWVAGRALGLISILLSASDANPVEFENQIRKCDKCRRECDELNTAVQEAKGRAGSLGGCRAGMSRWELQQRYAAWLALATARARRDVKCWGGGDRGHQQAQADAWSNVGNCARLLGM